MCGIAGPLVGVARTGGSCVGGYQVTGEEHARR